MYYCMSRARGLLLRALRSLKYCSSPNTLSPPKDAIVATDAEILATQEELAAMEAQRTADNGAYLQAKSDDEAAAGLLGAATCPFMEAFLSPRILCVSRLQWAVFDQRLPLVE